MNLRITAILISICVLAGSCRSKIEPDPILPPEEPVEKPDIPAPKPEWPEGQYGKSYIWDEDAVPEFHISFSKKQWNNLLAGYDKNPDVTAYFKCTAVFDKEGVRDTIADTGIRLFDNADAMRPEGTSGGKHNKDKAQWNMSNFELNFTRYSDSEDHTLRKVRSVFLKSCYNDPSYARERYCYDLFERFGIRTIGKNIYCRLNIYVEGDEAPAYIGLYQMIEPVDYSYIEDRASLFGSAEGNLWKCSGGASLIPTTSLATGTDNGNGEDFQYLLVTNKDSKAAAITQLNSFMKNIKSLKQDEFCSWIRKVCDVELLLRTYAVNVAVGMWDDYWNRGNNYYLYFNSTSADSYKVWFIPFDYEMSLGNSRAGIMSDPGRQNPYEWGKQGNPLIARLLQDPEFRDIYRNALLELTLPEAYLFEPEISTAIVNDLMYQASFHASNDTGIGKGTKDKTAPWSNHPEYRISVPDANNFFTVRSEAIRSYSE